MGAHSERGLLFNIFRLGGRRGCLLEAESKFEYLPFFFVAVCSFELGNGSFLCVCVRILFFTVRPFP